MNGMIMRVGELLFLEEHRRHGWTNAMNDVISGKAGGERVSSIYDINARSMTRCFKW